MDVCLNYVSSYATNGVEDEVMMRIGNFLKHISFVIEVGCDK